MLPEKRQSPFTVTAVGGRNQEMALAWAIAMASRNPAARACFASVASDGTDGPTDAAGGIVDPSTCARAVDLGLAPAKFLRNNDSFNLLRATGDLIVTGPTHTNLMDLQILLVADKPGTNCLNRIKFE